MARTLSSRRMVTKRVIDADLYVSRQVRTWGYRRGSEGEFEGVKRIGITNSPASNRKGSMGTTNTGSEDQPSEQTDCFSPSDVRGPHYIIPLNKDETM